MTEGFGLYPTIINPPYTTLTAYDLNSGTVSVVGRVNTTGWESSGIVDASSRKRVPPAASSNSPRRLAMAPLKLPLT